jgi:hypothetical protein
MNLHSIVAPIIGAVNPNEIVSVAVSIGNVVASDGSQAPGYATPGAITASIGGTFTASIVDPVNNPTTLNVSAVLTGSLQAGDNVSGTDGSGNVLPAGTSILSQITGPAGGVGTYQLSVGATLGSCTVTSASDVLNVSAVAAGVPQVGQTLADGVTQLSPGTLITGQLSGSQGSVGLYSISQQQTVASEAMTTSLSLFAQVQPMASGDIRHMDALNIQGSHRALYYNGNINGIIRVGLKGGDIVTRSNGSVWKVTQGLEPFFETAGWSKVAITLQDGS